MLFNSYIFIAFFLPITLIVFFLIGGRDKHREAIAWLVAASLFFYGWWNPAYLGLLLGSILFNYAIGVALGNRDREKSSGKVLLAFGIAANLCVLGYFKYANFFINNLNTISGSSYHLEAIILPLGISFITFQKIAYLVDAWKGHAQGYSFLNYCLFVVFFPQLLAGPIVHHKEVMPQFAHNSVYKFSHDNMAIGATIFVIGLFKKLVLADSIAKFSTPVFEGAEAGVVLTFLDAWTGALAYTFQLYFDFSGYSDMAIGLARMFGIQLPLNFNSPYKANNIIDFWRRWHMTLSRFLRDYLYIPLGGNRKGRIRRHINLFITMLLGGLWHGAGWTFVAWGGLHGLYLVINHAWRHFVDKHFSRVDSKRVYRFAARLLTFIAVVVAWVFFRAESMDGALAMLKGMAGMNGLILPERYVDGLNRAGDLGTALQAAGYTFGELAYFKGPVIGQFILAFIIAFWLPNTQQFMREHKPAYEATHGGIDTPSSLRWLVWRPTVIWALIIVVLAFSAIRQMTSVSEFLYFQF
jgi:D-alanyl-lipoteichoic acid acyltransferase DltB (MBOAT superfamily)